MKEGLLKQIYFQRKELAKGFLGMVCVYITMYLLGSHIENNFNIYEWSINTLFCIGFASIYFGSMAFVVIQGFLVEENKKKISEFISELRKNYKK